MGQRREDSGTPEVEVTECDDRLSRRVKGREKDSLLAWTTGRISGPSKVTDEVVGDARVGGREKGGKEMNRTRTEPVGSILPKLCLQCRRASQT